MKRTYTRNKINLVFSALFLNFMYLLLHAMHENHLLIQAFHNTYFNNAIETEQTITEYWDFIDAHQALVLREIRLQNTQKNTQETESHIEGIYYTTCDETKTVYHKILNRSQEKPYAQKMSIYAAKKLYVHRMIPSHVLDRYDALQGRIYDTL